MKAVRELPLSPCRHGKGPFELRERRPGCRKDSFDLSKLYIHSFFHIFALQDAVASPRCCSQAKASGRSVVELLLRLTVLLQSCGDSNYVLDDFCSCRSNGRPNSCRRLYSVLQHQWVQHGGPGRSQADGVAGQGRPDRCGVGSSRAEECPSLRDPREGEGGHSHMCPSVSPTPPPFVTESGGKRDKRLYGAGLMHMSMCLQGEGGCDGH